MMDDECRYKRIEVAGIQKEQAYRRNKEQAYRRKQHSLGCKRRKMDKKAEVCYAVKFNAVFSLLAMMDAAMSITSGTCHKHLL
jgi:hypothetical protein